MIGDARLHRHRPGRARDCSRIRARPSALQARSVFPAVWAGQRNLRSSCTRDFKSSASTVVSVGMREITRRVQRRNALSLPSRGFFALVRLRGGGFDSENGFAFLHEIETIARDRFQINRIGLEQIHFARLLGEQTVLVVALLLQLVDVGAADLQFFIRRNEETDDEEPDYEQKQNQEDTIPTLPEARFTSRAEIRVIHFQRILPPYCALSP